MQTAMQSGSRGREQTAARTSILLSSLVITLKVSCALFLVLNRTWGNPITARHTLHSGDCGWHRSEISIAATVQAVSLQRPSWTTGLICLYYTLPSYDLIWLNVWLREEDWPKPQLGILFAPVFVFSSDWTLSEETSEEACRCAEAVFHHHLRSAAAWRWNTNRPNCFTFFDTTGRNPHWGPHPSPKFF